jgi:hypothetical protein
VSISVIFTYALQKITGPLLHHISNMKFSTQWLFFDSHVSQYLSNMNTRLLNSAVIVIGKILCYLSLCFMYYLTRFSTSVSLEQELFHKHRVLYQVHTSCNVLTIAQNTARSHHMQPPATLSSTLSEPPPLHRYLCSDCHSYVIASTERTKKYSM